MRTVLWGLFLTAATLVSGTALAGPGSRGGHGSFERVSASRFERGPRDWPVRESRALPTKEPGGAKERNPSREPTSRPGSGDGRGTIERVWREPTACHAGDPKCRSHHRRSAK